MQARIEALVSWLVERGCVTEAGRMGVACAMRDLVVDALMEQHAQLGARRDQIANLKFNSLPSKSSEK